MDHLLIKKIMSHKDLLLVHNLEKEIWGMQPIPVHQTLAIVQNGGLMLGAFYEEKLLGYNYSFVGLDTEGYYLYSHMTGIHPDYRRKGIGFQLKKQQQMEAKMMGFTKIKWTYDPLEGPNGFLNLTKLRGTATGYLDNYYGDLADELNGGVATDRFEVTWQLEGFDASVSEVYSDSGEAPEICQITFSENGNFPYLSGIDPAAEWKDLPAVLVPVPSDFQRMKRYDIGLAKDWRMKTRILFHALFQHNFVGVHLLKKQEEPHLNYYIFMLLKNF